MSVNASAHNLRCYVGTDLQDWSQQIISFEAGEDKRSLNGWTPVTGTLELGIAEPPGPINPRSIEGQNRWYRGQRILIDTTNWSGNWTRHRYGWLYILKEPLPPTPSNPVLTLELGCILSLRNFDQPGEDESGVVTGASTYRHDIINALLTAAGCPELIDEIPLYPLDVPQQLVDSSYVELAGLLAVGGLCTLKQDNQGQIRAYSNEITTGSPVLQLTIGQDELLYEPEAGEETPCEIVNVCGSKRSVTSGYGTNSDYSEEYAPAQIISPNLAGVIVSRSVSTQEITSNFGRVRIETALAPAALVSPAAFPENPTQTLDSYTEERYYYGAANNALSKIERTVRRLFPAAMPEFYDGLETAQQNAVKAREIIAEKTTIEYFYTGTQIVQRVSELTLNPLGAIAPDETTLLNPEDLSTGKLIETLYQRQTPEIGRVRESVRQAIGLAFPDIEINSASAAARANLKATPLTVSYKTTVSQTGQANPPGTEHAPNPWIENEYPLVGTAQFTLPSTISANQERERTYSLEAGVVSVDQLGRIAQIEGALLFGRRQSQTIGLPLLDVFLTNQSPYMEVWCIEFDGTELAFQLNAIQIVHDATKAQVVAEGIWLGTVIDV